MERDTEVAGPSRRRAAVFFGVGMTALGVWSLTSGQTWVGVGQLVLAALNVLALVSPRADAFLYAPILRRNK